MFPGAGNPTMADHAHKDRMPTVSAAQALQDLRSSSKRCISTGLNSLDCCLQNKEPPFSDVESAFGGVSRGNVTEIYGPPGVGKTALWYLIVALPNPSARKFAILQYLISSLSKLAATRNLAIVITSQCVTKMRAGAGAVLVPAVNAMAWEQGLGCRVEMMRDWGWDDEDGKAVDGVRLVRVLKAEGVAVARPRLVGLGIGNNGMHALTLSNRHTRTQETHLQYSPKLQNTLSCFPPNRNCPHTKQPQTTPRLPQKRKLSATDLEIPDSDAEDDEDYGWAEEDEEELPPPPPQWQGSEDALAPPVEEEQGGGELLELGMGVGQGQTDGAGAAGGERKRLWMGEVDDSEDELVL
ncbi:hypothetical protein QTJ16_001260 [Diplocarpon rosae]|uniref:RecA family profile 1 domain-containing protein n=1 Tax=Diplocarpon rosae TaxID=946125 RepID=A0AAD9T8A2_9HELO|nr:hypothetical protein QTJ16_001260 [Diplocarpon rosae]